MENAAQLTLTPLTPPGSSFRRRFRVDRGLTFPAVRFQLVTGWRKQALGRAQIAGAAHLDTFTASINLTID